MVAAAVGKPGHGDRRGIDGGAVPATDNVGNTSNWVSATVKIDRTKPSSPTAVAGGSSAWQNVASVTVTGSGSTDPPGGAGLSGYQTRTSPDGVTWSAPVAGASATISNEGVTYVQVRSVDAPGTCRTGRGGADCSQHGRDRPVEPDRAHGDGRPGDLADERAGDGVGRGQHGCRQRDPQIRVRDVDERRVSWVGPTTGTTVSVSSQGKTLVQFRSVATVAGVVVGAGAGTDRHGEAERSGSVGRQPDLEERGEIAITASGSTDQAGGSGLRATSTRLSTNGGATWSAAMAGTASRWWTGADAGAVPVGRQRWQRVGLDAERERGDEYGTDRPHRAERADGDGWQRCDDLFRKKTVTASGSSDGARVGAAHYQYRVSPDNGVTWGVDDIGIIGELATHGVYLVQFQAVDNVGLLSAWAPADAGYGEHGSAFADARAGGA